MPYRFHQPPVGFYSDRATLLYRRPLKALTRLPQVERFYILFSFLHFFNQPTSKIKFQVKTVTTRRWHAKVIQALRISIRRVNRFRVNVVSVLPKNSQVSSHKG